MNLSNGSCSNVVSISATEFNDAGRCCNSRGISCEKDCNGDVLSITKWHVKNGNIYYKKLYLETREIEYYRHVSKSGGKDG